MSEVARTGFLIRGTKEKSEGDIFNGHHLHQIPIWTGLPIVFLASYRCISEYNSGTVWVQMCSNSMVILGDPRRHRRLFLILPLAAYQSLGRAFEGILFLLSLNLLNIQFINNAERQKATAAIP
jgi:hypothetical protein